MNNRLLRIFIIVCSGLLAQACSTGIFEKQDDSGRGDETSEGEPTRINLDPDAEFQIITPVFDRPDDPTFGRWDGAFATGFFNINLKSGWVTSEKISEEDAYTRLKNVMDLLNELVESEGVLKSFIAFNEGRVDQRVNKLAGHTFQIEWPVACPDFEELTSHCINKLVNPVNERNALITHAENGITTSYGAYFRTGINPAQERLVTFPLSGSAPLARYLTGHRFVHRHSGLIFPVYSTHLSTTESINRLDAAKDIVNKIKDNWIEGDMLPVLIGDFNSHAEYKGKNKKVWEHIHKSFIDFHYNRGENRIETIWVGRPSVFENSARLAENRVARIETFHQFNDKAVTLTDHPVTYLGYQHRLECKPFYTNSASTASGLDSDPIPRDRRVTVRVGDVQRATIYTTDNPSMATNIANLINSTGANSICYMNNHEDDMFSATYLRKDTEIIDYALVPNQSECQPLRDGRSLGVARGEEISKKEKKRRKKEGIGFEDPKLIYLKEKKKWDPVEEEYMDSISYIKSAIEAPLRWLQAAVTRYDATRICFMKSNVNGEENFTYLVK